MSRQYHSVSSPRRAESAVQCHGLFPFSESVGLSIFALSPIRLALLAMRKSRQYASVPLKYYFVLLTQASQKLSTISQALKDILQVQINNTDQ
jgi:hypothetical protein